MTTDDLRTQMEMEAHWRQEEIIFFNNVLSNFEEEETQNKYRKGLVLILYSHLEGFVKVCLQTYVQYINEEYLGSNDVILELKTSAYDSLFRNLENTNRKVRVCSNSEEDGNLQRFARRVEFIKKYTEAEPIVFLEEGIINTESNLHYYVLQKNLFQLGLPVEMFEAYKTDIDALVNRRNSIAHGDIKMGVSQREYENWKAKVNAIFTDLPIHIYDYTINKKYRRC